MSSAAGTGVTDILFKRAMEQDAATVLAFIDKLNVDGDLAPTGKLPNDLLEAMAYRGDLMFAFIAESGSEPVGFALAHDAFTSDVLEWGVFLVDLYVEPAFRQRGIARGLVDCVASEAKRRKATHLWWTSMANNADAHAVYDRLSAKAEHALAHALIRDKFETAANRGMSLLDGCAT